MNRVIETFAAFKTEENLPGSWVKKVWVDSGFAYYVPFSTEYDIYLEEVNIADVLNDFYEALRDWFRASGVSLREILENDCSGDGSSLPDNEMNWQLLNSEGIDYKSLICIIGTLVSRFLDDPKNSPHFRDALYAIRLYSYMIAIPGSHICQIFNSTLYSHVVSVIKIGCEHIDSSVSTKNKGVKRKKDDCDDDMEPDESEAHLNCDKTEVITITGEFLSHLKLIFDNKKFKMDATSVNLTIQILMVITRLEKVYTALLVNSASNYPKHTVSHIAFKSFMILLGLSGSLHSNPIESAKLMIKSMMQIFLITELRTIGLALKDASIVRMNYIYFLKMLLDVLGESAYEAVNILVQRICVAVPDRAEMRLKASSIVLDILKVSPPDLQAEEIYSIVFMSHMAETKIRLFTMEIISKLLLEAGNLSFSQLPQKYAAVTNNEFLLAVIFYRCQDAATSIRTKALSYLDQLISSANTNRNGKKLVEKIFIDPYRGAENPETVNAYQKEIFDTQQFLLEERFLDDCSLNPLPGVKVILDILVYFSQDDKVFTKKCAIQTLARIFLFNRMWIKNELLQVFLVGCDDSSVLIRKTMSQILTDLLLMYPDHEDLVTCWVEGVVPMIAEEEIKAQEKVIEHFCKVILNNIMYYPHTTSVVSRLPWLVMKEILRLDKRSYLHFTVGKWVQTNAVKSKTIQMIYSHIDTENNDIAWCLLVSFSQFMNLPNSEVIYDYYERILNELDVVPHSQLVLEALYYSCSRMPKEAKTKLLAHLEAKLMACTLPLKLIARSRDVCEQIISTLCGKKTAQSSVIEWSAPKIQVCIQYIEMQIGKNGPEEIQNTEILLKYIFMLGEFAQAAPTCVNKSDIKLLENLLLSPRKREADAWQGRASNALKAVTILTLVKLVLQKEETANSVMPIFREILSSNSVDSTIQVNTIIGMCDLCSRYTTLVERYFTCICKCFYSQHEMVRKTALVCVMKRIREEYVKLRPFILFPMLTMILDSSVNIKRTIATFIVIDLKKKNNVLEMFYTGLFFFLNNSKEHSTTVKIPDDLRTMFSLTDKPEDREYIYVYILDKLADTNRRLVICKKIINDIMASVADEVLKVDEKTENILTDAFNVLIDNEKKISEAITKSKKNIGDDAEDIEELNEASQSKKSSQGHGVVTVTEGSRLNEANEIIPIMMKLRLRLKKHKSKCLKNLMAFLCELMKNFKNEMSDLLGGDGELKAEIEYNLRQMEQEEEERKRCEVAEAAEVAELADSNEHRSEDENRNIPMITTSPEEICEQLQNLIVQLSRCDDTMRSDPKEQNEAETTSIPIIKLTKCDRLLPSKQGSPELAVPNQPKSLCSSPSRTTKSPCQKQSERIEVQDQAMSEDEPERPRSVLPSPSKKTKSKREKTPREIICEDQQMSEEEPGRPKSALPSPSKKTKSKREKTPSREIICEYQQEMSEEEPGRPKSALSSPSKKTKSKRDKTPSREIICEDRQEMSEETLGRPKSALPSPSKKSKSKREKTPVREIITEDQETLEDEVQRLCSPKTKSKSKQQKRHDSEHTQENLEMAEKQKRPEVLSSQTKGTKSGRSKQSTQRIQDNEDKESSEEEIQTHRKVESKKQKFQKDEKQKVKDSVVHKKQSKEVRKNQEANIEKIRHYERATTDEEIHVSHIDVDNEDDMMEVDDEIINAGIAEEGGPEEIGVERFSSDED